MRRIAIINQKGGVGKTTTAANLAAALARAGQRVLVIDMDPQANLSLYLGAEPVSGEPSSYSILCGGHTIREAIVTTSTPGLSLVPAHIDLSGADLELAAQIGRETILRDALDEFDAHQESVGEPYDFVLLDCPPSLGLLSINALTSAQEVMLVVQTEFFALQGLSKLVEIVQLIKKRMNPALEITTIVPCLYDSRLKLAREVLAELRRYFPGKVADPVRTNVRLAESPSYALTIFDYAPESNGATDYAALGSLVLGVSVEDLAKSDLKETAMALKAADREAPARRRRLVSKGEAQALESEAAQAAPRDTQEESVDPSPAVVDEAEPDSAAQAVDEAPEDSAAQPAEDTAPIEPETAQDQEPVVELTPRQSANPSAHRTEDPVPASSFGEGVDAELAALNGEIPARIVGSSNGASAPEHDEPESSEAIQAEMEPETALDESTEDAHEASAVDADAPAPPQDEQDVAEPLPAVSPSSDEDGSAQEEDSVIEAAPPRKAPLPVYGFGAYLGEDFDAFAHANRPSGS